MFGKGKTGMLVLILIMVLVAGCATPAATPPAVGANATPAEGEATTSGPYVNSVGKVLPADAAPPEQQVLRLMGDERKHMDISASNYDASSACGAVWMWERLVSLDENYEVVPACADSWEMAEDGLSWTFNLQPGLTWSDGSPLTAADFEYGMKRQLDPKTGSSFGWFYADIKNAGPVYAGQLPPDQLGVVAKDDVTLVIETEGVVPYLPMLMAFPSGAPVPRKMVEQYGDQWSTNPETCLTNGPYKLEEWTKGQRIVLTLNPNYKGRYKGSIEKMIFTFGMTDAMFTAYQAGEIDGIHADAEFANLISASDLKVIERDPKLSAELLRFPYLGVQYIFFPDEEPFDDIRVRQAFSHAIDRDKLVQVALGGLGVPAFGMLPPGMPGYPGDALNDIQRYDPELARQLLADAGYPDGKGFPVQEFWVREPDQSLKTACEMIQAMLKENLGVDIQIMPQEKKVFVDVLGKKEMPLAIVHWMYDYVDPSDFLNVVWHSEKGRHTWKNAEFDALVDEAMGETDAEKRIELYQQANRVLSEDVGAVFLWYPTHTQMWKPYVKGIQKDLFGYARVPYAYLGMMDLYIAQQ